VSSANVECDAGGCLVGAAVVECGGACGGGLGVYFACEFTWMECIEY